MKTALKIIGAIVALVVVVIAGLYFTGMLQPAVIALYKPHHGWDLALKAPVPDYAKTGSWAALPSKDSPAMLVPKGVAPSPAAPEVDVFFIHPTGYMSGADWNSPLDPNSRTEENTKWMMANQASVFNGCCAVYAPRYREASIFRYFALRDGDDLTNKTMDLAYGDVDRAFTYFLEHYSKGRPFIIASHSQGTHHALRLIQKRIDGTPLANRMVAAYIIGGGITDKDVAGLKTVRACESATDLHCIVHWMTFGEDATLDREGGDKPLCTNPLTWKRDGGRAPASDNKGAVAQSGRFQIAFWGSDAASGVQFGPLPVPVPHQTWAECRKGLLFVAD
ncbi:MAG TPA: DUF3089 domain-containing protein, partial [Rhizomicrobium sp.]|nr:DUF3089 domain-containing protein [Rhizomicrobium sp.]